MKSLLGSLMGAVTGKTPIPMASTRSRVGPFGIGRDAGSKANQLEQYGAVGTLFSVVHRLSEAEASYQWWLERVTTDQRRVYGPLEERRQPIVRHAAADLWAKPNPFMPRQQLMEIVGQHLKLCGEGWLVVSRDPRFSVPLELWPVRPDRMQPVPHPTEFLAGYIYTSPDGEKVPLGLDEVITLHYPDPSNLYRGLGPVQTILHDLDSARYSAEWNSNFFANSAEPGGIIEVDRALGEEEFNELRDRWNEQHRGVANAHRVAILEHGKWVDRKFSQRDMQFAELRNLSRDVIMEAFAFPKPMLGITEDVNRANAEAAEYVFGKWSVKPDLARWRDALNHKLLPLYGTTGQGVEFCHEDPVPDDKEFESAERTSKSTSASTLVTAGWNPDDVLAAVGLPPMRFDGGRPADAPEQPAQQPA